MDSIKRLYKDGISILKISKIVGLSKHRVRKYLDSSGVRIRKSMRYMTVIYGPPKKEIDRESSELLALHAGDGCLHSDGKWSFSSDSRDAELLFRVISLLRNVVGVEPRIKVTPKIHKTDIISGHSQVRGYFSQYFPVGEKSYIVKLPSEITESDNPEITNSALRGLISSDGCFSFRKRKITPRLEFRVKSATLRDQFVNLAEKVGFSFNKSNPKHKNGVIYTAYTERIQTVLEWMKEIGSSSGIHKRRFDTWLKLKYAGVP